MALVPEAILEKLEPMIMEKGLLGSGVRIVYYNSLSGKNTHL